MKAYDRKLLVIAILSSLVLLSGCKSPDQGRGFVYRQWASRMTELGIFPVFPLREDIYVGDVYLLPLHPYDTEMVGAAITLG